MSAANKFSIPLLLATTFAIQFGVGFNVLQNYLPGYSEANSVTLPTISTRHRSDIITETNATLSDHKPPPFDYKAIAVRTKAHVPLPAEDSLTKKFTVIIVLSARSNFQRRAVARETWAKGCDNVYFLIGGPDPSSSDPDAKEVRRRLMKEQRKHSDLIDSIHPDSYKGLTYKLHYAMKWVVRHLPQVRWIVKTDDDALVRVRNLQRYLGHLHWKRPTVLGRISNSTRPKLTGKWAEDPRFNRTYYPPFPFGSAGYVVSRPVANYLADRPDLHYYQGEDVSLGIWLDESPLRVQFSDMSPHFSKHKECTDQKYIIGHNLSEEEIRQCFRRIGDSLPKKK